MVAQWYRMYGHVRPCNSKALFGRSFSVATETDTKSHMKLLDRKFPTDSWTNVTKNIISKMGCNLHLLQYHPLSHIRQRIVDYFYNRFHTRIGNPVFSVYDNISPIVSVAQNFDSLLVPPNHSSRKKSDCYYVNRGTMLRAHMTAHQSDFISMGLNNFLVIGDVYRRDKIDSKHYPVFHQADAVRLCTAEELFQNTTRAEQLNLFEHRGLETNEKQACHTLESVKMMEHELKNALTGLAQTLFGAGSFTRTKRFDLHADEPKGNVNASRVFRYAKRIRSYACEKVKGETVRECAGYAEISGREILRAIGLLLYLVGGLDWREASRTIRRYDLLIADIKYRWVEQYFPFTHPSWELEVHYNDEWIEILGCGIMRQEILEKSGAGERIGWAFGLGLERLAMCLYDIPNIRLFWSKDTGFLNQFKVDDPNTPIKYKPISIYPQCKNDISFWLPEDKSFSSNEFYDIVRQTAGDRVEQVILIDEYTHPESNKVSHCYTIIYRHMERTLSKREVNNLHTQIANLATKRLRVTLR